MLHLNQDEILEFAAGRSATSDAERIYEHLDACEACSQRLEAIQQIRSDFEGSWEEFSQELRFRVHAIAPGVEELPAVDVVIRGVLDASRRLATAAVDRMTDSFRGTFDVAFQPAYSGVGDPARVGPAGKLSEEAASLCEKGQDDEALSLLQEAARLDPQTGASASLALLSRGRKVGEVSVDAARSSVSVIDFTNSSGTAVLTTESGEERRAELEPVEGASYSLAEFENVPSGPFSFRLER